MVLQCCCVMSWPADALHWQSTSLLPPPSMLQPTAALHRFEQPAALPMMRLSGHPSVLKLSLVEVWQFRPDLAPRNQGSSVVSCGQQSLEMRGTSGQ